MIDCGCKEFEVWKEKDVGAWIFLRAHGIVYPKDGPFFKFCPFCGKKATEGVGSEVQPRP
jgi:hypothetical protein